MKTNAIRRLREKLAADTATFGLWVTLESPSITEMAVALGIDWVVIDAEHGHLDWKDLVEHLRATARSETVALVRVAELNGGLIKRALDIGADGIVVPWIETPDQLRQAIAYARYPLAGQRGIGAERATCWGQCFVEHTAEANEHVLVVPILETVATEKHVTAMSQVDGAELFFFGPADFSSTAGARGQWEGPGVAARLLAMKDTLRRAGKHCGLIATSHDNLLERQRQGFRLIGLGIDAGLLARTLRGALAVVGRDRPLRATLTPDTTSPVAPLSTPPESFRPDRPEVITPVGRGVVSELARGVTLECLAGSPHGARNLTTGIVTFAPGAALPYHQHTFAESITPLGGLLHVEVEGRIYSLRRCDNLLIPAGHPHQTRNPSTTEPVSVHVAVPTTHLTRTLVDRFFPRRVQPDSSTGTPGAERVTRFAAAARQPAGPQTEFIDYFHGGLVPGLEMSGGYGLFHPTGRLPAHIHDFDESICIVGGAAICVVEGHRYELRDRATALQPRGRVHYFSNDSSQPMEMIWVYAGSRPERIVVEERCATAAGAPWNR